MTGERPAPRGDDPRVLAFVAPWCGPCRRLEPTLAEVAAEHDGVRLVLLRVDEHPDEVARLGVRATPTTVAVHGDDEVARVVGAMSRAEVERLFEAAATRVRGIAPTATGRTDLVLRFGVAAVLAVAGIALDQSVLLGAAALVGLVTAVVALPRRRPATPARAMRSSRP